MDIAASNNIGKKIKEMRQEMHLSLDALAKLTGVSKAMLGQIERGESMPTILTLWKISSGLKVTLSNFVAAPAEGVSTAKMDEISPVEEEDGKMLLYNIFPFDPVSGFDYFYITMEPGCVHKSMPHVNVMNEYVFVTNGKLEMTIDEEKILLEEGSALYFRGTSDHTYANAGEGQLVFQNIVRYI